MILDTFGIYFLLLLLLLLINLSSHLCNVCSSQSIFICAKRVLKNQNFLIVKNTFVACVRNAKGDERILVPTRILRDERVFIN